MLLLKTLLMALQSARQSVLIYNVVWIIFILTPLGILFRKVVTYHGLLWILCYKYKSSIIVWTKSKALMPHTLSWQAWKRRLCFYRFPQTPALNLEKTWDFSCASTKSHILLMQQNQTRLFNIAWYNEKSA